MASQTTTATVEVLTAEVRVLMVGSRQVTLSVFRQLDEVAYEKCDPLGRVNDGDGGGWIVGRDRDTGALVRATIYSRWRQYPGLESDERQRLEELRAWRLDPNRYGFQSFDAAKQEELEHLEEIERQVPMWQDQYRAGHARHKALPLIVLAGLK